MNQDERSPRSTYVLRCWSEKDGQGTATIWRFALEDVSTRQQIGFANTNALFAFLQQQFVDIGDLDSAHGEAPETIDRT